jgi:hypothetical protein
MRDQPRLPPGDPRDAWLARVDAWVRAAPPDPPGPPAEDAPATFRARHYGEYRRRLLAVYAACAGWPRAAVAPLWPWVAYASERFEGEDPDGWRAALAELERYTGGAS